MNSTAKLFFFFFLFGTLFFKAQQRQLDSLETLIKTSAKDSGRVKLCVKLAFRYRFINPQKTIEFARQGLQLASELHYLKGIFKSYEALVQGMHYSGNYHEGLAVLQKWLTLSDSVSDNWQQARCYNGMGLVYSQLGEFARSIEHYFKAIKIDEALKDKHSLAADYGNIALVYEAMKKYPLAMDYVNKAMKIDIETGDKAGYANAIGNLSNLYDEMGNRKKSLEYALKFLELEENLGNKAHVAGALSNIGSLYDEIGEKDKALEYYKRSMELANQIGNDEIEVANRINIAAWHLEKKQYGAVIEFLTKALTLSVEMDTKPNISECYRLLAIAFHEQNDNTRAYQYLDRYNKLKDTLLNEENTKQINQMTALYEKDKQQLKIDALEKEKKLSEEVIEKQNNFRNVLVLVVALIILLLIVLLAAFVNKRKVNRLLETRNAEIQHQKEVIEETNKNMKDSINYARLIQEAILPAKEVKYKLFPDAFVLYRPRDIVSGDFYWFAEKNGKKIIAAVDCTGHGVPGAFMSMIGIDQLNHIVLHNGITQPAEILNQLQNHVRQALKQDTGITGASRDGMDIALCAFHTDEGKIEYAGANRPLVIVRKTEKHIETVRPDHASIGGFHANQAASFTNHSISLKSGDCLYFFTDGFADQFGGAKGKKFRLKNLKELLLNISEKNMNEQEVILENTLDNWKGKLEQVDDVLVIGVRI